jgi:hypothetical protein
MVLKVTKDVADLYRQAPKALHLGSIHKFIKNHGSVGVEHPKLYGKQNAIWQRDICKVEAFKPNR